MGAIARKDAEKNYSLSVLGEDFTRIINNAFNNNPNL